MKKNKSVICLICGIVSIMITIIFYILAFENIFTIPMRWLSLMFLLVIEMVSMVKALKVPHTILGTTTILVSIIHLGVVILLSLVFVNVLPIFIKKYVLINLLLVTIVATIDVLLILFSNKAEKNNARYINVSTVMGECILKASELQLNDTIGNYKTDIEDIVEMLKYSNKTVMCGFEMDILSGLEESIVLINTDSADEVSAKLKIVKKLIKKRLIHTRKQGKF